MMTEVEAYWDSRVLVRWMCTQWCNYGCWYCRQDHSRKQVYKGGIGHWADTALPAEWMDAFAAHFSRTKLSLQITGGEPMLGPEIRALLMLLDEAPFVEAIRIDTNGSFKPWRAPEKVHLMVSYHPTEISEAAFRSSLDGLLACGWKVEVINYVARPGDAVEYPTFQAPLNVLPAFGDPALFSPQEIAAIKGRIHPLDQPNRFQSSTYGKPCLFPTAAYEMEPDGRLRVGCHPELRGSLFGELPGRLSGYTPCPDADCFCVDKYTFLQEIDSNVDPLPLLSLRKRIPLL